MKKILYILAMVTLLGSCTEKMDIDLDNSEPTLVIQANIIDSSTTGRTGMIVRVSTTAPYFSNTPNPVVPDAVVNVSDNKGNNYSLVHSGNGYYYPNTPVAKATPGDIFTLTVTHQGKTYSAVSQLKFTYPMDSLSYKYKSGQPFYEDGYYLTMHAKEDIAPGNYYRFFFRRKNAQMDSLYDFISVANDDAVNGKYINLEIDIPASQGDSVEGIMYSMTKEAAEFYRALQLQTENGGGPFGSTPENLPTNIKGGAFGCLNVSLMTSAKVYIK